MVRFITKLNLALLLGHPVQVYKLRSIVLSDEFCHRSLSVFYRARITYCQRFSPSTKLATAHC